MTGLEDMRLLRAFLSISECGSISAAARVLNTSQPTLSRRLGQLEHKTGVELLRRDIHVLLDWKIPPVEVYVAFPIGKHPPGRLRSFVDFATAEIPRLIEQCSHPTLRDAPAIRR